MPGGLELELEWRDAMPSGRSILNPHSDRPGHHHSHRWLLLSSSSLYLRCDVPSAPVAFTYNVNCTHHHDITSFLEKKTDHGCQLEPARSETRIKFLSFRNHEFGSSRLVSPDSQEKSYIVLYTHNNNGQMSVFFPPLRFLELPVL